MLRFAIRDDDTSFWSKPEELEALYRPVWDGGGIVSLAVIPFAVESVNPGRGWEFHQNLAPRPLAENRELVAFLRNGLRERRISVMLHGYNHEYRVRLRGTQETPLSATRANVESLKSRSAGRPAEWIGEYAWKDGATLERETREGRACLEELLGTRVSVFVPPSNDLSRAGARAVARAGLDISGQIQVRRLNRPLGARTLANWLRVAVWRRLGGGAYPFGLDYGTHRELCAHGLVPGVSAERLAKEMAECERRGAPFVLATHYWEALREPSVRAALNQIYGQVISRAGADGGARWAAVAELVRE